MGNNCPSGYRGTFTPGKNGVAVAEMKMKPVDVERITFCADSEHSIPMMDGVELIRSVSSADALMNGEDEIDKKATKSVPLIVEDVDLCVALNAASHRTASFHRVRRGGGGLVARRGAPFRMELELNRTHDRDTDILCLVFSAKDAPSPSYSQNTEVLLPVSTPEKEVEEMAASWRVRVAETKGRTLTLEVTPSPSCIVGEWRLEVDSRSREKEQDAPGFRFQVPDTITLLFNPWCEGDTVFLPGEEERGEYVLSDSGLVWRGSHHCPRPCIWNYAQFDENILECCLYLLSSVGHLKIVDRADPVSIVRHLSAVLHARDGGGVLASEWSGKYRRGGKSPTHWGGSPEILQKYFRTKRPVKYGQCWVYAGLFTTVCRCLGIPSRPVTNFSSAHDTRGGLTVDRFFDAAGRPLDHMDTDSLWSFHVWSESWMRRPDLEPGGYGGWQAADCTPHEESDGVLRCGPASVSAVRRGEVRRPFDTSALFTAVNADKVYWGHRGPQRPLKLIRKDDEGIGLCISTKAVGKYEREDITHEYKHEERAEEGERETMLRALRQCKDGISRYCLNEDSGDVRFELTLLDDILIGTPFTVQLKASDTRAEGEKEEEYTVKVSLHVHSALYTGQGKKLVKRDEFEIQMAPGVENVMRMVVSYEEYCVCVRDQCSFVVSAAAHVVQTGTDFCAQDDFRVRMPDIGIQVDGEIVVDHPVIVTATLTNPLPRPLRAGEFILEGPGFGKPTRIKIKGTVAPGADAKVKCRMTPSLSGNKVVLAKFAAKEMGDCDGYHVIAVKPTPTAPDTHM